MNKQILRIPARCAELSAEERMRLGGGTVLEKVDNVANAPAATEGFEAFFWKATVRMGGVEIYDNLCRLVMSPFKELNYLGLCMADRYGKGSPLNAIGVAAAVAQLFAELPVGTAHYLGTRVCYSVKQRLQR